MTLIAVVYIVAVVSWLLVVNMLHREGWKYNGPIAFWHIMIMFTSGLLLAMRSL